MSRLSVQHLTRRFAHSAFPAVQDVSFEMDPGEILALVGPSGCGKTTTLRLIAGLERPDEGLIRLDGRVVASQDSFVPAERRGVGMVFQEHALFPHLSAAGNVAFGLRGKKPGEAQRAVAEMLALVGLEGLANRYPHALSGGERQRVALARALAPRPLLLLMDEPFSSLDSDLRMEMREQVRGLFKQIGATVLFVTHDQEEALAMGDRLAVFRGGRIEQVGTPDQVFAEPATRFVAEFMGNSHFLPGEVTAQGIATALGLLPQAVGLPLAARVEVAVRADDVDFTPDPAGNAEIVERRFRGMSNIYRLRLDSGRELPALTGHTRLLPGGQRVRAFVNAGHPLSVFPLDGE